MDMGAHRTLPRYIPESLEQDLLLDGKISKRDWFFNSKQSSNGDREHGWTEAEVEKTMQKIREGKEAGTYKDYKLVGQLREAVRKAGIAGKTAMVIGSELPWVEAILLVEGVGSRGDNGHLSHVTQ